jgi:hypothetical protein
MKLNHPIRTNSRASDFERGTANFRKVTTFDARQIRELRRSITQPPEPGAPEYSIGLSPDPLQTSARRKSLLAGKVRS